MIHIAGFLPPRLAQMINVERKKAKQWKELFFPF
jgi:hypothetical protein